MPVLRSVVGRIRSGLRSAWNDLASARGVAYTSPIFAFPIAYVLVYGLGALLYADRMGSRAPVFGFAVAIGLTSYILAVGATWRSPPTDASGPAFRGGRRVRVAAGAMVAVGVAAMVAYLVAIGGIPLFMDAVEEGRVAAAERGGAALRVTSLLALPGVWLLVAEAGASRRLWSLLLAMVLTVGVAGLQILSANRAPAFLIVQVAFVAYLLSAGIDRMRPKGLASVAAVGVILVIAAGAVGGYRFSGSPATWRDPAIARGVASGDSIGLTAVAARNYLIVPIQNFSSTMDAVPSALPWRLGYTYLQSVITVLPGRQTTFDQDLKEALGQDYAGGGTVPSLLGESYANFGPLGWVAVPAILGVALTGLNRFALRQRTVAAWVLFAWALVHVANATISGLIVANIFPYIAAAILVAMAYITRRVPLAPLPGDATGVTPERPA